MVEAILVSLAVALGVLFWLYRKDQKALLDRYYSDHVQHFNAMLGHCEWMGNTTEQALRKLQDLSTQVAAARLPVNPLPGGDPAQPSWSLDLEREAAEEALEASREKEDGKGKAGKPPEGREDVLNLLKTLHVELGEETNDD